MNTQPPELIDAVIEHLDAIYPDIDSRDWALKLIAEMQLDPQQAPTAHRVNYWNQSDIALITYGDSVRIPPSAVTDHSLATETPLQTLHHFWRSHLKNIINVIHILPFFPYSSDDGFAVTDYSVVNPGLGSWSDISALSEDVKLMADLVINHVSSRSLWFENYRQGLAPGRDFFVECDPNADLSQVVRPRTSPLLRATETHQGTRHLWCTFSHDQLDLNFGNPEVLFKFVQTINHYLRRGIRWIRLDAIAYLWKQLGTTCIHLPQTHEVVRLLRLLIEHRDPEILIITETNVPNSENLTYFGNANEAHMVYNFSLPPLLIHTLLSGDCHHLKTWLMSMPPPIQGTCYLNFIASHDGIGLRPTEGLLTEDERSQMVATLKNFGALVSQRETSPGNFKPYEINISLIDAFAGTHEGIDAWQIARFVCAHAIMLALEGVPAFYIHSLLGTQNDHKRVAGAGHNRAINRHRWDYHHLLEALDDADSLSHQALVQLSLLITLRKQQPAFHPNAPRTLLHLSDQLFGFWRQAWAVEGGADENGTHDSGENSDEKGYGQRIFCIYNVSNQAQTLRLTELNLAADLAWHDLVSGEQMENLQQKITLKPYQFLWLTN